MAPKLPNELVDIVIGELQSEDTSTIARCGLVCKNWLPTSRYRLFAEVHLNDGTMDSFFDVVHTSPFPLRSFIRSLALDSELESGSTRLSELGPLPQATTLRITMQRSALARNTRLLTKNFPNLSTLVLHDCRLPLRCVLKTVSSFSSLQTLELRRVDISYDLLPFPSTYHFPPHWRALTLDAGPVDSRQFFRAILALDTIPVFSSLSVRGMDPGDDPLSAYLRHIGARMHCLHLEDLPQSGGEPAALSHSTGLRHLYLASRHQPETSVLRILPHLRSNALTTMTLVDYGIHNFLSPNHRQWERLDQTLNDERFVSLNALIIKTLLPQGPAWLPLSAGRGILQTMVVHRDSLSPLADCRICRVH
ncbi:hypothetical protein DFH07DRAFT_812619 [Mycena maculata]|uniref:F-box domain-containing protein n=1 Tax=Mycena maculata TaxID=230809 RepID=A0AAD7JF80_9AGAR|nr:hypothetical protein DFH07DRAFT_812619 [Mycena maculata]